MTTDEPQAERPRQPTDAPRSTSTNGRADQSAPTQAGPLMQELDRLTRRLPGTRASAAARSAPQRQAPPPRERIAALIAALGDPGDPRHATAIDELAAIGAPAVPALCAALDAANPWLTVYRATEALAQIGDGRAAGPLSAALNHPNSNVRWGAVRALAEVGDARTLLLLRRVAQDDRGKTSWGESVSGAAQSALDQIRDQSPWRQGVELAKTAVTCVIMLVALALAFSVVTMLRDELGRLRAGVGAASAVLVRPAPLLATAAPAALPTLPPPTAEPAALAPTLEAPIASPTPLPGGSEVLTGTVLQPANVRPIPSSVQNVPVGRLAANDEVVFLTVTPDGLWYKVRLGERYAPDSAIESPDGVGWVSRSLVTPPAGIVPPEEVVLPTPPPAP